MSKVSISGVEWCFLRSCKKPIRILDLFCRIGSPFRAVAPLQEFSGYRHMVCNLVFCQTISPERSTTMMPSAVDSMVALRREREELNSS
jgi:hypothetical protein